MAFDPSKPAHDSTITSAELRDQFNALAALIDDLRTRLDALPGRGTDAFVSTAGNDATAALGDPARPFRTAQAAFDAALVLSGDRPPPRLGRRSQNLRQKARLFRAVARFR